MKIGFVSDIHANLPALKTVFEEIKDLDKIFCSGDIVGYNPFPSEVIDFIKEMGISSVLGNHDLAVREKNTHGFNYRAKEAIEWTIDRLGNDGFSFLENLPRKKEISIDGFDLYITHGSPSSIKEYIFPDTINLKLRGMLEEAGSDILVLGHTHFPMIKEMEEGYVINPGSVGQPRDGDKKASYIVFDSEKENFFIERIDYDINKVIKNIKETDLPDKLGKRLLLGK